MDNNNEKNRHDVMVSNLPLLFSDGNPSSLDVMTAVSWPWILNYPLESADDGIIL